MSDAAPATFNLTEEEKAVLRKTLRVVALEPDRIELEVKEETPRERRFNRTLAIGMFGALVLVSMLEEGLSISDNVVRALPMVPLYFLIFAGTNYVWGELSAATIVFFPGTAWAVHRRRWGRRSRPRCFCELLTRIEPVKAKSAERTKLDTSLRLTTDLDVRVITRRRFDEKSSSRCRQILSRLVASCARFSEPSPTARALAEKENVFLDLPRPSCRALAAIQYDWEVVSMTNDQLVIRRQWTGLSLLLTGSTFLVDSLALLAVALMAPPYSWWLWMLTMAGVVLFPRVAELAWANRRFGKTIRMCRTDRSVVIEAYGEHHSFASSSCEAICEHISVEDGSAWTTRLQLQAGWDGSPRKAKRLATWMTHSIHGYAEDAEWRACEAGRANWRPEHDTMENRGAKNIQGALRYYLDQCSLDDIACPAQERTRS